MSFIVIGFATCLFVALASKSIKKVPWLWYSLALVIDIVYFYGTVAGLPPAILSVLSAAVQRGLLGTSLLIIVMYCGVFSERSRIRKVVSPIRAELSIIACILLLAHCLNYFSSYIDVLLRSVGVVSGNQLASLIVAVVLVVLLLVLSVTSIRVIKCHMKTTMWKNIQRGSYIFFALIYVHELLILYPSALKRSGEAFPTLVVGAVVFLLYFALRIARCFIDRKERNCRVAVDLDAKGVDGA